MDRRSLVSDGLWVSLTQILSVIGQLIGVRLLTEVLSPGAYGELNLWLGVVGLMTLGLAYPTFQALLRFYPEYMQQNRPGLALIVTQHQLLKLFAYLSPLMLLAALYALAKHWLEWPVVVLILLLTLAEIVRTKKLVVLNAVRAQQAFGFWQALETWARYLLAYLVIVLSGPHHILVLAAFFIATVAVWLFMRSYVPRVDNVFDKNEIQNAGQRFWQYTLPLLPLGVFAWLSGMADRYMVAGMMTARDVGIYAAAYGLASRPMIMLSTIVEVTMRPVYHNAVIAGDKHKQNGILLRWAGVFAICSLVIFMVSYFAHSLIASLLLGAEFRSCSRYIPWIVLGYILLGFSHVLTRIQYAMEKTRHVAFIEISGTLIAVICSFFLIQSRGLDGAVLAVILGFAAQLCIASVVFLRLKRVPA